MSPSYAEQREPVPSPPLQQISYHRHGYLRAGRQLPPQGGESKTSRSRAQPLLPAASRVVSSDVAEETRTPENDGANNGGAKTPRSAFLGLLSPRKYVGFRTRAVGFFCADKSANFHLAAERGASEVNE